MIFLVSCEEVVEIDVPSGQPKLVISAIFEVYFDENPVIANTDVTLNISADYFEEGNPIVTNAAVFITNLSDNSIITYNDANQDGVYKPSVSFIPEDDINYELTVIYDGETYKATNVKQKTPVLNNVEQGDETLFSGEETELKVSFTDDATQENYYIFDFDKGEFGALEDRFFNGSDYEFSSFYQEDEVDLPETVEIKFGSVTKDYFDFFRVVLNQSGENGGGPFQSVPASLLGNIVNQTNFINFPLGYFHISEIDRETVDLVEK